jgi:hypothetical protein
LLLALRFNLLRSINAWIFSKKLIDA